MYATHATTEESYDIGHAYAAPQSAQRAAPPEHRRSNPLLTNLAHAQTKKSVLLNTF